MVQNRGTNVYFNNFKSFGEQQVVEDLTVEAIKIFGENMFYVPRKITSMDTIFTEDDQSVYEEAYPIEMYIKNVDGFDGDGVFLSKFGLQINDQVTFTVARRTFKQEVTDSNGQAAPQTGDIVFFPLNGKCFQIKYVNYKPFFYQLGQLVTYDLVCELFTYSDELFNTGYPFIDKIMTDNSTNILQYAIEDEDGNPILSEDGDYILGEEFTLNEFENADVSGDIVDIVNSGTGLDSSDSATSNTSIIDWTYTDPFSEGNH